MLKKILLTMTMIMSFIASGDQIRNQKIIVPADDASYWRNVSPDTTVLHDGKPTVRWEHAKEHVVDVLKTPRDWSTQTHLHFWLHSAVRTNSGFIIKLDSENPQTEGQDYYHYRFIIDWTGWKEFVIPVRNLAPSRKPLGLDKISNVFFICSGWDYTPDARAILNISSLELCDYEQEVLPESELFNALDFTTPGLEAATKAWEQKDIDTTRKLVADYFRNRTSVPWRFNPHDINRGIRHNKEAADKTVAGFMREVCVDYTYPNGDIDWYYNHTKADPNLPNNNEWQWQLNRMGFWHNLGATYWATGDETYARTFVKHLRSWTKQCKDPRVNSGNYADSSWRTIECGIRLLGSWPDAYHYFLHSPSFTDADLLLFIRSSLEQMRHLLKYSTSGNWLTMEMNGVYTFASLFPELKEAQAARRTAASKIYADIKTQFLPDGAQFELTPGYHQVALGNIMGILDSAKRTNHLDELPEDFSSLLAKAYEYNLKMATPNRDMPRYNDSWGVNVVGSLRQGFRFFPDRKDFEWMATDGASGEQPDYTSCFFPWAGFCAMRSSWAKNANFVGFDVGPLGRSHVHQDKLNVVIWAGGQQLLFDDGGGCYESSIFRRYATTAFGHNTILIDGLPQNRDHRQPGNSVVSEPIDANWLTTSEYDYACASYDQGFGKPDNRIATHRRQVLFLKPDIVIVADTLIPNNDKEHTYQARWQVNCTELVSPLAGHPALLTNIKNGPKNLLTAPLFTDGLSSRWVSKQTEPEVLGWYVIKDAGPYIPAATILHERKGTGPQRFLTMFMPATENPVRKITRISTEKTIVEFTDQRKLSLTFPAAKDAQLIWDFTK